MGTMRFRVFPTERITGEMVQQAYLSGIDRVSWPVRPRRRGGRADPSAVGLRFGQPACSLAGRGARAS